MTKTLDASKRTLQCYLTYISEYTTDIHHIQGKNNPVADALPRVTITTTIHEGIDCAVRAAKQKNNVHVQAYCRVDSGLQLEDILLGTKGTTLILGFIQDFSGGEGGLPTCI